MSATPAGRHRGMVLAVILVGYLLILIDVSILMACGFLVLALLVTTISRSRRRACLRLSFTTTQENEHADHPLQRRHPEGVPGLVHR